MNGNSESTQTTYSTIDLFGLPISRMGMQDTLAYLAQAVRDGKPCQVVTINPIMIMDALEDERYMATMQAAELLVPDGTGVVWAADRKGMPVGERVPGIDLMHGLFALAEEHRWRIYLLGAEEQVIQEAKDILQLQYPLAKFVGCRDGYFDEADDEAVIAEVRDKSPDLLFVARSAANQEPWINEHKAHLGVPVIMGVGGSFDVISGRLKRAPAMWRKLRLEWLYRLIQEPWRYKRMLALPRFVLKVLRSR